MKLECQAIHGSLGKRVDINLETDTKRSLFNTWHESRMSEGDEKRKEKKLIHQPVAAEPTSGGSSKKTSCANEQLRSQYQGVWVVQAQLGCAGVDRAHSSRETVYGMATPALPKRGNPRVEMGDDACPSRDLTVRQAGSELETRNGER